MATNGVLKITTRLAKDKFKQDLKGLTKDIKVAEAETNAMGDSTEAMASGLGASVGAIAKIAVIAGLVVSAFILIKKAVENITQNNEQIAGKIEAIKNALSNIGQALVNVVANIIFPIVEKIVNFIYKILSYVNAITKAWWGYDLFAENASENLASGASSAQAIEKALAGFDTADILGSDKKGTIGGTDVKNVKKYTGELTKIPKWLQKIIDLKPKLDNLFTGAKEGAKNVWKFLKEYNPLIGLATGGISGMVRSVDNLSLKWKQIRSYMEEEHPILWSVIETIGGPLFWAVDAILYTWDDIKLAISKCIDFVKDLKSWADKVADKFTDILSDMGLIGKYEGTSSSGGGHSGGGGRDGGSISYTTGTTYKPSKVEQVVSALFGGVKKIFGLASGGIVNNPGKGVALNQIIAGEKGPEAVLPLTDGTLQKLASMIPVQIELTNTIDGRVLSRRLETIRQDNAFSRNGV